jgi:hypothetical protein
MLYFLKNQRPALIDPLVKIVSSTYLLSCRVIFIGKARFKKKKTNVFQVQKWKSQNTSDLFH